MSAFSEGYDFFVKNSGSFATAEMGADFVEAVEESARQQAMSVFERFLEYDGPEDILQYISARNLEAVALQDPIYSGQMRIIPRDQLAAAREFLQRKIQEEAARRPEQVERYRETLQLLALEGEETSSFELSELAAERLAKLAREGKLTEQELRSLGVTAENMLEYEEILRESFKAGMSAVLISMVLRIAPELLKAVSYLIKTGEVDEEQLRRIGLEALQGGAEDFVRGSVAASLTTACKSGMLGEAMMGLNPAVIGAVTVIGLDTMKNAYKVAMGRMDSRELVNDLVKNMFVATCSVTAGTVLQSVITIPVLGYMLGSFVGTAVGAFAYHVGANAVLSFCVTDGFTLFGFVEQDYQLPEEVLKELGAELFEYERFDYERFAYEKFGYEKFAYAKLEYDTFAVKPLRRGVIGVYQVGYV